MIVICRQPINIDFLRAWECGSDNSLWLVFHTRSGLSGEVFWCHTCIHIHVLIHSHTTHTHTHTHTHAHTSHTHTHIPHTSHTLHARAHTHTHAYTSHTHTPHTHTTHITLTTHVHTHAQKLPPKKDFIRGVSYITGFVIRAKGTGCALTYVTQSDPRGVCRSYSVVAQEVCLDHTVGLPKRCV